MFWVRSYNSFAIFHFQNQVKFGAPIFYFTTWGLGARGSGLGARGSGARGLGGSGRDLILDVVQMKNKNDQTTKTT